MVQHLFVAVLLLVTTRIEAGWFSSSLQSRMEGSNWYLNEQNGKQLEDSWTQEFRFSGGKIMARRSVVDDNLKSHIGPWALRGSYVFTSSEMMAVFWNNSKAGLAVHLSMDKRYDGNRMDWWLLEYDADQKPEKEEKMRIWLGFEKTSD